MSSAPNRQHPPANHHAQDPLAALEAELQLTALEAHLKTLLAQHGVQACAMWDRNQHRNPVQIYAVPEPTIVEPAPHITGLPWHGRLGHHNATHLEPAFASDGTTIGTRLTGATFQIALRPAIPPFIDVQFRADADLAVLVTATTTIHDAFSA